MNALKPVRKRYEAAVAVWLAVLVTASLTIPVQSASAASSEDPDWPCIQRQVPRVSAGMVWAGPTVEEVQNDWRQDFEIQQLAGTIAARATPMDQAKTQIGTFAAGLGAEKDKKLTQLFNGTLAIINSERGSIIAGIKRYARRQAALADKIAGMTAAWHGIPADGSPETQVKRGELEEQILWDTRIFEEREQSLSYICEQPVLLEQRIFALSREIMSHLD